MKTVSSGLSSALSLASRSRRPSLHRCATPCFVNWIAPADYKGIIRDLWSLAPMTRLTLVLLQRSHADERVSRRVDHLAARGPHFAPAMRPFLQQHAHFHVHLLFVRERLN